MREVGACETRRKLGQLLDLVELGEEVTVIRHGRPVARLTPLRLAHSGTPVRAAIFRLRERAEAQKLGHFNLNEWKSDRDKGRP